MLDIIKDNPYHFLGVYTNTPLKKRTANISRLKAYLNVKKEISFPNDFPQLLPTLKRSIEGLKVASNEITLPEDKLKYALFWFINKTPIDEMGLKYLENNNTEKANDLFSKKENYSSLINKGVLSLIQDNIDEGVYCLTKVIHSESYLEEFNKEICGDSHNISEKEIASYLIETLNSEHSFEELNRIFNESAFSSYEEEIIQKKLVASYLDSIKKKIELVKEQCDKSPESEYKAGLKLINITYDEISDLKNLTDKDDTAYQITLDKLSKAILQYGINYFNNSKENDEYLKIEKSHKLQAYALSISVGKLTKDRCKQNVSILKEIKQNLPPKEVLYYDKQIKKHINELNRTGTTFEDCIIFIQKSFPHLMSVKELLGKANNYYLKLSTLVASSALEIHIGIFNDAINGISLLPIEGDRNKIKSFFYKSWQVILYLDKIDKEIEFDKNIYIKNRNILKKLVEKLFSVYNDSNVKVDDRSERDIYIACNSKSTCKYYLLTFPSGKYSEPIKNKIENFEFNECRTLEECYKFINKYPKSLLPINDKIEEAHFRNCKTTQDFYSYLSKYPAGKFKKEAKQSISDEKLWEKSISDDTKSAYQNYLTHFPNGKHKFEAERKVSPCYIATMVYGDYNHPQVIKLRRIRDYKLQKTTSGRLFIQMYYKFSPTIVNRLKNKKIINKIIKRILDKFI